MLSCHVQLLEILALYGPTGGWKGLVMVSRSVALTSLDTARWSQFTCAVRRKNKELRVSVNLIKEVMIRNNVSAAV